MRIGSWFMADTASMPLLRTPAVLFSVLTGLLSLSLARRIFRDDRAALLVTLLSAAAPMFVVGALLITIDSPMYLGWAAAVYCLWRYVEAPERKVGWLYLAGLATGLGMLCKPVLIALPACAAIAAFISPTIRRRLATGHSLAATLLALALQTPIIVWNAQHHWVTFLHIKSQGGFQPGHAAGHWYDPLGRLGLYIAGQAGALAGVLFVLLVMAVVIAWRSARGLPTKEESPAQIGWKFLLAFALPLWIFYALLSLWTNTEVNWPAASYFAGMILLAGVVTQHWHQKAWRHWTSGAVIWGILLAALAQHTEWFYPAAAQQVAAGGHDIDGHWHPKRWDPSLRVRARDARGVAVEKIRQEMAQERGQDPLIATARYDTSSSLSFYLPDHPFVYCLMTRFGGRQSQYDIWPGLDERRADDTLVHAGQDLLLIGADPQNVEQIIRPAFARVEAVAPVPVYYHGVKIWNLVIYKCYNFKGFVQSAPAGVY